jgi:hypothetical protein
MFEEVLKDRGLKRQRAGITRPRSRTCRVIQKTYWNSVTLSTRNI